MAGANKGYRNFATFPASTTADAPITLGIGVAPSSPVNGQVWMTSSGMFYQSGGATIGPLNGPSSFNQIHPFLLMGA